MSVVVRAFLCVCVCVCRGVLMCVIVFICAGVWTGALCTRVCAHMHVCTNVHVHTGACV